MRLAAVVVAVLAVGVAAGCGSGNAAGPPRAPGASAPAGPTVQCTKVQAVLQDVVMQAASVLRSGTVTPTADTQLADDAAAVSAYAQQSPPPVNAAMFVMARDVSAVQAAAESPTAEFDAAFGAALHQETADISDFQRACGLPVPAA